MAKNDQGESPTQTSEVPLSIGRICTRVVATAAAGETVADGAARMAEFNVGSLVVVDGGKKPIGFLTDRDVALRVVGQKLNPSETPLSEIMSTPLRSLDESTPLEESLFAMEKHGIRRIVVTGLVTEVPRALPGQIVPDGRPKMGWDVRSPRKAEQGFALERNHKSTGS